MAGYNDGIETRRKKPINIWSSRWKMPNKCRMETQPTIQARAKSKNPYFYCFQAPFVRSGDEVRSIHRNSSIGHAAFPCKFHFIDLVCWPLYFTGHISPWSCEALSLTSQFVCSFTFYEYYMRTDGLSGAGFFPARDEVKRVHLEFVMHTKCDNGFSSEVLRSSGFRLFSP